MTTERRDRYGMLIPEMSPERLACATMRRAEVVGQRARMALRRAMRRDPDDMTAFWLYDEAECVSVNGDGMTASEEFAR